MFFLRLQPLTNTETPFSLQQPPPYGILVLLSCVAETPRGASGLTTCCQLYSAPCTGEFFCVLHLGLAFCAAAYVDTHIQAYKPPPAVPERAGVPSTVEGRVDKIDILLAHAVLRKPQSLAEALEMHDLPGPQELDDIVDVRVVGQAQDVVIGDPGLLLCCNHIRTTFD